MRRLDSLRDLSSSLLEDLLTSLELEGTHGLADVEMALSQGSAQLWLSEDGQGAAVTEVNTYPSGLMRARIWLSAGKLDSVLSMDEAFSDWARELGCEEIELLGRRGWARVLKEQGWEPHLLIVTKRL